MARDIDDFYIDSANSLDNLTGKQFDALFDSFCQTENISKADCEQWAEDFQTFLSENPTFVEGSEQARLVGRFAKVW